MWDSKKGRVAVGCGVMVVVSVLVGLIIYYASKDPYCKCEDLNRDRPPFVCPDPVITVEEGSLVGSCKPDITGNGKQYAAFFGVPYAQPPVGELRFKEPRPADKWVGVRDAKVQDDTVQCVQNVSGTVSGREDCLYMNIYVPETSGKDLLPVQFYIHGGGFVVFTNQYSGGDFFVHNDVIHVGFEYRLGVFGFLNLQNEIAPGNAGLKDQLAALQWVNRNIQRFGGDPEKVTIVGESAGSMSVHWLTLLPQTEGLFRAAIMKSGAAYDVYTDKPKYFGEQLIKNLSKITPGKSVEDLLLKSTPDQLIAASPPFVEEGPFRPTFISVEKRLVGTGLRLVTQDPESLVLQRVRSAVPMMIGVTSCEMAQSADAQDPYIMPNDPSFLMLVPGAVIPSKDTQRVLNISAEALGYNYEDVQSAIRNQFFKNFSADCDERCRFKQYIVQQGIKLSAIRALRHQAAFSSAPVYAYQYSYPASPNDECAYHGADDFKVWPIFANTSYNGTSPDSLLLRRLVKFISNFIKYMDPVPDMTDADIKLRWPSMKAASPDVYLNIGKELSLPGTDLLGSDGPFWTNLFKKYRDGKSF